MLAYRKNLEHRGSDAWGDGSYGASRGSRSHRGIDYEVEPGTELYSPVKGRVTKIGLPYTPKDTDKITYRYLQITDYRGFKHRIFYLEPSVAVDRHVDTHTIIGFAQNIASKYSTDDKVMKNHVHYEIIGSDDQYINPEEIV